MKKVLMGSIAMMLFALTSIIFQMSSCKKADAQVNCPTPTYQIAGLWIGTYSDNSIPSQGQLFFSLSIYPDGSILYKSKAADGNFYFAKGTWTISGNNIFSAAVTTFVTPNGGSSVTQNITATYSNTGTLKDATWNDITNPNGSPSSGELQSMLRVN